MDWFSFLIGVAVTFCLILGLPWLIVIVAEAYDRIKGRVKGGEGLVVRKIIEKSVYSVCDDKGNVLKSKFKDLLDAHEYAIRLLNEGKLDRAVLKAEVTLMARRVAKE